MQRAVKGKNFSKWANEHDIYEFEKEIDHRGILTLPWGFIHVYEHYNQTNLLVYILDLR